MLPLGFEPDLDQVRVWHARQRGERPVPTLRRLCTFWPSESVPCIFYCQISSPQPILKAVPVEIGSLDLREAAIHEQLRSCDEAAVVRCQKHDGLGNLIGLTEPAERDCGRNGFQAFCASR